MEYSCIKYEDGVYYPVNDPTWIGQAYIAYQKFFNKESVTDEEIVMIQWWGNGFCRHKYTQDEVDRIRSYLKT